MLSEFQRDLITVVLVSPRNPLNIGAAARAMANFGFSQLTVAAPYEPHWREAKSAVGAETLLQNSCCTQSLAEAVVGCSLVLGTATLMRRKPEQPALSLPDLAPTVEIEFARGGRAALVFGPEKRGLTRQNLALCHRVLAIPTHPRQPSMNLAQAVAVCLYELAKPSSSGAPHLDSEMWDSTSPGQAGLDLQPREPKSPADVPATSAQLDLLAGVIARTMAASNYSPSTMRNANRHDLHLLLRRLALSKGDARRILGLFRRILWRLEHRGAD